MPEVRHLEGIDVVRGLAVLGVVARHTHHQFPTIFPWLVNLGAAGATGV